MSKSIVCTLFEGHYHYGFAGLVNSLYANGYRGEIYAGYRGLLPPWAFSTLENNIVPDFECRTLQAADKLLIHFIKLETNYHFTNYKAHFMLTIWKGVGKNADNLFYFDPDITNKCSWSYYEQWVRFGVALVHEIVLNDMPASHPKRELWRQVSDSIGIEVRNNLTSYINAGFIGINKTKIEFLELWCSLIEHSSLHFNLDKTKFSQSSSNFSLFTVADQDLLNLAAMCTKVKLSEMGPDAMDFINGGWTMSHATGLFKPWKKNFLFLILKGMPPSSADKEFWRNTIGIIRPYKKIKVKYKMISIKIALFIGRFYRKN